MLDADSNAVGSYSVLPGPAWTPSLSADPTVRTKGPRRNPSRKGMRPSRHPAALRPATVARRESRALRPAALPKNVAPAIPENATELLREFQPLVQKIAGGFQRKLPRHVLREDLVAAGMAGLWDAIRRHGSTADDGFEWYVRVRVRGAILDELRSQDWLSRRARAQAEASGQSIPPHVVHLDDMREPEQARCLAAPSSTDAELDERSRREALAKAVDALPERERLIVSEHYFRDVKFKCLGAKLGVSEPRISQLHSRAMKRLREMVGSEASL